MVTASSASKQRSINDAINDYNLKTDLAPLGRQGRLYGSKFAEQPAGIKIDEMIFGVKMAHVSLTDDTDDRLKGWSPNVMATFLECIGDPTGHEATKPLTTILKDHFDLNLDCHIDISGIRRGRALDTQGFIASNDTTIVLSYRHSTTGLDWMTNFSFWSNEWEPLEDELQGHAGDFCNCLESWFTKEGKPRVHTGFYNNMVYTIPMIRQHILEPLLKEDATPKKVYICGHSLGGAISTIAFCFVLQCMLSRGFANPDFVNHKIINVTMGSPRICKASLQKIIMEEMQKLRPLDRAVICRLVYNNDIIPHLPLSLSGFVHFDKMVYITLDGEQVMINPKLSKYVQKFSEVTAALGSFLGRNKQPVEKFLEEAKTKSQEEKTDFEIECEKTPLPVKDHMTYFYLMALEKLKARVDEGEM